MFWEERCSLDDFLVPGRDLDLPEENFDVLDYLKDLFNQFDHRDTPFTPFEKEYSLRNLPLPLSDEKNFEEYPLDDQEDDPFGFDPDSIDQSIEQHKDIDENELSWEDQQEYDLNSDKNVPFSYIEDLRYQIYHEGNTSKRPELAMAIARFVLEQYAKTKPDDSRKLLEEAKKILAELISEGKTEYCIHYARLLNEVAFIEFVFPKGEFVSMLAIQESIKYLLEIKGTDLAEEDEILEQLNGAWRIQADSFERNGAINSALGARLREEELREDLLQAGDIGQIKELAIVYGAIASNRVSLGDYTAALEKYRQAAEIWDNHIDEWDHSTLEGINVTYRLAMVLHYLDRDEEAIAYLEERTSIERSFVDGKDEEIFRIYANHLQIHADFYIWTEQYDRFLNLEKEIVLLYEKLAKNAVDQNVASLGSWFLLLADTYKTCGYALHMLEQIDQAFLILNLAVKFAWAADHWFNIDSRPIMIDIGSRFTALLSSEDQNEKASSIITVLIDLIEQLINEDKDRVFSIYPRLLHHFAHLKKLLKENADTSFVLDKCIKYWENIVIDQGKLGWREAYAASLGERGSFYLNEKNDYEKALYDFSKAASILQEIVEDEEDYSLIPLYAAVITDKGNALDKMDRKTEALPVVLSLFDFWTDLYLKKKIWKYFDRYYELGLIVIRYYFMVNGVKRAINEMDHIIDNQEKIKRGFLNDPDFEKFDLQDPLDYTLFTFRLVKLLGLNDRILKHDLFMTELRNLQKQAYDFLVQGKYQYIEKEVAILENFFSKGDHGEYEDEVILLMQQLLQEILDAMDSNKIEWIPTYGSLFDLLINFSQSLVAKRGPDSTESLEFAFDLAIRFAAIGYDDQNPLATSLYCAFWGYKSSFLFLAERYAEAKNMIHRSLPILNDNLETGDLCFVSLKGIACYNLGSILIHEKNFEQAKIHLREAIDLYHRLVEHTDTFAPKEFWGPDSLRTLAKIVDDPLEKISCLEEAAKILIDHLKHSENRTSININIIEIFYQLGCLALDSKRPETFDINRGIQKLLLAEDYFDRLDYTSKDENYVSLFRMWELISYGCRLINDRKNIDELVSRISIWEIAIPEHFDEKSALALCEIKYDLAYYYALESLPQKAIWLLDESINIHSKYIFNFDKIKGSNPFILMIISLKAWALAELGKHEEGLWEIEKCHKQARKHFCLFIRELKKGDESVWEYIGDFYRNYRRVLSSYALCLLRSGHPRKAIQVLDENLMIHPWLKQNAREYEMMIDNILRAECFCTLKRYTKAIELLDVSIELLQKKSSLISILADAYYFRANVYYKTNHYSKALIDVNSGIDLLKDTIQSGKKQGIFVYIELLLLKVRICCASPFSDPSSEDVKKILQEAENYWNVALMEGRCYYKNLTLDIKEIGDLLK